MKNFIFFSLVYILIFSGYYLTTSFLNILYPNNAFWSFVIFYGTYALGSLFAPYIVKKMNFKLVLFLSCLTFCIFVGFSGSRILTLLFIGSFIGGLGNSVIWLIQGVFLESNEMSNFYAFFNINIVFGNIFGLIILVSGLSIQIMILSMLAFTTIATFLSLFIKKKEDNIQHQNLSEIFKSFKKAYLISPSYLYQAIGLNVTYQIIPRLINMTNETEQMRSIYNSIVFICYGISAIGFSWLWGKIFVKNWKYVVIPYSILETICLILILILAKFNDKGGFWIIIGMMRGIIDYGINNNINITLSQFDKKDVSSLFSLYRFIYAIWKSVV